MDLPLINALMHVSWPPEWPWAFYCLGHTMWIITDLEESSRSLIMYSFRKESPLVVVFDIIRTYWKGCNGNKPKYKENVRNKTRLLKWPSKQNKSRSQGSLFLMIDPTINYYSDVELHTCLDYCSCGMTFCVTVTFLLTLNYVICMK